MIGKINAIHVIDGLLQCLWSVEQMLNYDDNFECILCVSNAKILLSSNYLRVK